MRLKTANADVSENFVDACCVASAGTSRKRQQKHAGSNRVRCAHDTEQQEILAGLVGPAQANLLLRGSVYALRLLDPTRFCRRFVLDPATNVNKNVLDPTRFC
jgi:hypothetical protein